MDTYAKVAAAKAYDHLLSAGLIMFVDPRCVWVEWWAVGVMLPGWSEGGQAESGRRGVVAAAAPLHSCGLPLHACRRMLEGGCRCGVLFEGAFGLAGVLTCHRVCTCPALPLQERGTYGVSPVRCRLPEMPAGGD